MTTSELLIISANGVITLLILLASTMIQLRKSRAEVDARVAIAHADAQQTINDHYDALTRKWEDAEARATDTALRLSDASHNLELLRISNEHTTARLARMESELDTSQAAAEIAFEALKNANRQIEELSRQVRDLESGRAAAQREITDLKARIAELITANRQIDELTRRVKELESERAAAQREIADLKSRIQQLQTQLDAERKIALHAAGELETERQRASQQETRLREQALQIQELSVQIAALQAGKGKNDEYLTSGHDGLGDVVPAGGSGAGGAE